MVVVQQTIAMAVSALENGPGLIVVSFVRFKKNNNNKTKMARDVLSL